MIKRFEHNKANFLIKDRNLAEPLPEKHYFVWSKKAIISGKLSDKRQIWEAENDSVFDQTNKWKVFVWDFLGKRQKSLLNASL